MKDDVSDITALYNRDPEKEHLRLEQHQLEYDLTCRFLDRYLPAQGAILEVGAATGRYTLDLAKRGHLVTAVDMSSVLLEKCRTNLQKAGLEKQVRIVLADARDLSILKNQEFDAVLLMGPLYHLIGIDDRSEVLTEASNHLRIGGILFSTVISRFGLMGDLLKNDPAWIEKQADVHSILEKGKDLDDYPRGGFRGYYADPAEVEPLHEAAGFETLVFAGVEPGISADDESYNQLQGIQRQLWLDIFYEMSTEKSIIGASRHLLYIGKKKII